ncbi:MAG TPA: hypothetical protein VFH77_00010 [Streptomyces sp.]|jgi:hypothetical protein|nr:hypothetical protein [Streptomyces sp.]
MTTTTVPTAHVRAALDNAEHWLRTLLPGLDPAGELHATARQALAHCERTSEEAPGPIPDDYRPGQPGVLLRADRAALLAACRAAQSDGLPADVRVELSSTLPAVLVAALRCYDLILGAVLLRAVAALLGNDAERVRGAIDFLLAQQQPDGSFGAFGGELEALGATEAAPREDVPPEALLVPVTAACVAGLSAVMRG